MQKSDFGSGCRFGRSGEAPHPVSIPHVAMLLEERKQGNPSGAGIYRPVWLFTD